MSVEPAPTASAPSGAHPGSSTRVLFVAALTRALMGLLGLFVLPILYPGMTALRTVIALYLGAVAVEQVLIAKRLGGVARSFVAGLVDIAMITLLVHRAGSLATPLVSLYVLSGTLNSLAVGLRAGLAQAVLGSLSYFAVLLAERAGTLAYGPDAPAFAARPAPTLAEVVTSAILVTLMMFVATGVVGFLKRAVREREHDLAEANKRLHTLSIRDPLTGLFNRRHMLERLELELARARRGHSLVLLLIDLDGFKRVNDQQGHLRGDMLLEQIAATLASVTREIDVVSRYGGDEFVVLLTDADRERADAIAGRLVDAVRVVGERFEQRHPVTASLGIAVAEPDDTPASLLRRADEGTYRAKRGGGNRVAA